MLLICSFLIGLFVSCTPLPRYWIYSYDIVGTCSDVWDWGGYYMGLNLLLDIWLIVLPSQYVWKAVMDRRTKLGVIAMFGLGLMCVQSLGNTRSLLGSKQSITDFDWDAQHNGHDRHALRRDARGRQHNR